MRSRTETVPTPWVRKSTALGRRRVSLRLRVARGEVIEVSTTSPCALEERGTKRTSSPVGTEVKRMRLTSEERSTTSMGEEIDHNESIEGSREREDEHNGAIDPDMQVSSSYSSSSGESGRSLNEEVIMMEEEEEGSDGRSELYLEEEDIEDEDDDGQNLQVDKTEIIFTSDEDIENEDDELEYDRWEEAPDDAEQSDEQKKLYEMIDGPKDTLERMTRFRKLSLDIAQRFDMAPLKEPKQFSNRCRGIGPASEVWTVLVHKDDLHSICNEKFMEPHGYDRCRRQSENDPIPADARSTLIDWMQDVCWAEKLHRETFHLAVDYVDRVMAKGPSLGIFVQIGKYQLLGTTALFIAAKFEEIYPPKVEDIVQYTDHACDAKEVRHMEMIVLKVLEWEVSITTPLQWAALFLELLTGNPRPATSTSSGISLLPPVKEGFFYEDEPRDLPITEGSCMRDDYMHVAYVMDVVILHDGCRKYTNRLLAAAVMYEIYDADDSIGQVTGFSVDDKSVRDAREWVHPIVQYCEMNKALNLTMPTIDGVRPDAVHTYQLHREKVSNMGKLDSVMEDISNLRNTMQLEKEKKQRPAAIIIPHL